MSLVPKTDKNDIPVIDIDTGGDADAATAVAVAAPATNDSSSEMTPSASPPQVQLQQPPKTPPSSSAASVSNGQTLDSPSFWKAGDYVVGSSSKPAPEQAIAELVDNAVDEMMVVEWILNRYGNA